MSSATLFELMPSAVSKSSATGPKSKGACQDNFDMEIAVKFLSIACRALKGRAAFTYASTHAKYQLGAPMERLVLRSM
ncbi:hypothetical protein M378DRAFT_162956 [Amanita muscaria Koide BX008]|uniref:Uncharacterized protein n=1 Tax=Amanita muscaria (strain Koide BX008) TaxID=946122 RepID=A0A0C2WSV3_AMAMK|nr:hypothetical protein M378DRAFT_162956 [Amanita muscaria Koide BX008]